MKALNNTKISKKTVFVFKSIKTEDVQKTNPVSDMSHAQVSFLTL